MCADAKDRNTFLLLQEEVDWKSQKCKDPVS